MVKVINLFEIPEPSTHHDNNILLPETTFFFRLLTNQKHCGILHMLVV